MINQQDNSSCEGEWEDGKQHGYCTFINNMTGITYKGLYKDGKRNGKGISEAKTGDKYDGDW